MNRWNHADKGDNHKVDPMFTIRDDITQKTKHIHIGLISEYVMPLALTKTLIIYIHLYGKDHGKL